MATNSGSNAPPSYGGGPGGIYGGPQFSSNSNSNDSLSGYGNLASLFSQYYGQPVPGKAEIEPPLPHRMKPELEFRRRDSVRPQERSDDGWLVFHFTRNASNCLTRSRLMPSASCRSRCVR